MSLDLYRRSTSTLVASWEAYARGAIGASVQRLPGVTAAVFPRQPERAVYNNALLARDLGAAAQADAVEAMKTAYAGSGVDRFAAWVHEADARMRAMLEARGYTLDTATRAMGMILDDACARPSEIDVAPAKWSEHLRLFGLAPDLVLGIHEAEFHVLIARINGEPVAAAVAFDHEGDCGIFNVATLEHARRRGLATALTARQVHDARARGCQTVSLQSTAMAERVYAAVGFSDLGQLLEYVPMSSGSVAE